MLLIELSDDIGSRVRSLSAIVVNIVKFKLPTHFEFEVAERERKVQNYQKCQVKDN